MKPLKIFTLILTVGILSVPLMSGAAGESRPVSNGSRILLQRHSSRNPHMRPNAPSRQLIDCTYNEGLLTFNFTFSEGMCDVYLTEISTGMTEVYSIDSSDLTASVYVGTIESLSIEIVTEQGHSYVGIL